MRANLPAVLFLIPFLSAVSMPLWGLIRPSLCLPIVLFSLITMSVFSILAFHQVWVAGPIRYAFGGWTPPLGIEWLLDGLSGIIMVLISVVGLVTVIYAGPGVRESFNRKIVPFYTLVLLLISALTGMVLAADLFNLFVFLEVASLSAYALVAVAGGRAMLSAFRYLILGTIGASFYLLGVGYLYASTGTLNMADLSERVGHLLESKAVLSGIVFIMIGLGIKTALVPLHGWLPDAYTDASDAVTPIIAALMTKVALYALTRITFWILGAHSIFVEIPFMVILGWVGAIATLVGAFLSLSENNLKRMFAYGGISHVGLVVVGLSLGNSTGLTGGIFYLINDTVMQAGLFFVAGVIIRDYGITEVQDLVKIRDRAPWIMTVLIVTAFSMIGIPPTGGFFGKWYLILGALEAQNYVAVGVIILGTLLTLAYFARVIEKLVLEKRKDSEISIRETPVEMRFGMGVVVVGILFLGLWSDHVISLIQDVAIPTGFITP